MTFLVFFLIGKSSSLMAELFRFVNYCNLPSAMRIMTSQFGKLFHWEIMMNYDEDPLGIGLPEILWVSYLAFWGMMVSHRIWKPTNQIQPGF